MKIPGSSILDKRKSAALRGPYIYQMDTELQTPAFLAFGAFVDTMPERRLLLDFHAFILFLR
jgi:hypothetical protein